MLPLFPLGTVLFPGLVLPLHVFEDRYRQLVRDLLELPEEQRQFGVIAIREGREVGADGTKALFEVGCAAQLHQLESYDDGRYDLITVGTQLFRLTKLHTELPYFTGEVEWLTDQVGDAAEAEILHTAVRAAFSDYLTALGESTGQEIEAPDLPDDPLVLSYLVAATMLLDLADRQDLLDQPDGRARLQRELSVLRRETALLRTLTAAPAHDFSRTHVNPN